LSAHLLAFSDGRNFVFCAKTEAGTHKLRRQNKVKKTVNFFIDFLFIAISVTNV